MGGSPALRQLDGILKQRRGSGLDAGFAVKMPGNYILMYAPPDGEMQKNLLATADEQIADIAGTVKRSESRTLPHSFLGGIAHSLMYGRFASHVHEKDLNFSVNEKCTSCGTCAAICPVENIEIIDGKPVWKHHCELCCGCIHLCPVQAIQSGPGTEKRQRYKNPSVSIQELERNREKVP
jgi:ferredoxin